MRKGMWWLVAVAGVGLASGCQRGGQGGDNESVVRLEEGRLGKERAVEQPAPLEGQGRLGGEDMVDQEAYGTVTSVGQDQFVVRTQEGVDQTFRIEEDTRFVRDGAEVQRQLLREGSQVRTAYDERDGAYVAAEVTLQPSGSGAPQEPTQKGE